MWGEGRAYGYIRFKKSVPTENIGVVRCCLPGHGSAPVLMLLLLSIIATAANKTPVLSRCPSVTAPAAAVCPAAGCMLCGNEARYRLEQGATGNSSPFPCYFKISDIKLILTVLYYNRATINAPRIRTGYLRLLACVICPWGRGLIVWRVLCV